MPRPIRTVSFDLWDTILIDDSDEPKRARAGRPPKSAERMDLMELFLNRHQPIARDVIAVAYATADAAFRRVWYGQNTTWSVRERLVVILQGLGCDLPTPELAELVRRHEEMEKEFIPDLAPGVKEAIVALHGSYTLAVISDTIFSPGRVLRQILAAHGLLGYFDSFVFSDEAGCSKPARRLFEQVATQTACGIDELVHIGDRPAKDIDGPRAAGARGVLVTVVKDRRRPDTTADAVCDDYRDLPGILERLAL